MVSRVSEFVAIVRVLIESLGYSRCIASPPVLNSYNGEIAMRQEYLKDFFFITKTYGYLESVFIVQ